MNVSNVRATEEWFEVLQTSTQSQTAIMKLEPGGASGSTLNAHEKSEQVLLVIRGEVEAHVAGEKKILREGDVVIVPAGTKHRFTNPGESAALTFSVYAPPEYPAGEKG